MQCFASNSSSFRCIATPSCCIQRIEVARSGTQGHAGADREEFRISCFEGRVRPPCPPMKQSESNFKSFCFTYSCFMFHCTVAKTLCEAAYPVLRGGPGPGREVLGFRRRRNILMSLQRIEPQRSQRAQRRARTPRTSLRSLWSGRPTFVRSKQKPYIIYNVLKEPACG